MQADNSPRLSSMLFPPYAIVGYLLWTLLVAGLILIDVQHFDEQVVTFATAEARADWDKDQAFRRWATKHGGLYVKPDSRTPPNPYLTHIENRDIETTDGTKLTLMNPAYMMRQMTTEYEEMYGIKGRITGQVLLNPVNKPDPWELSVLKRFDMGEKEVIETTDINGQPYLRLMRPMIMKTGCVRCHGHLGFKVGDIRGGVSVSIPLSPYFNAALANEKEMIAAHGSIWLVGLFGIGFISVRTTQREIEKNEIATALEASRKELTQAQKIAHVGSWSWDVIDHKFTWSDEMHEIFGISKADFDGTSENVISKAVHPDDRHLLLEAQQKVVETGKAEPLEYRIVKADSSITFVWAQGRVIKNEAGNVIKMVGTVQDITQRKQAENLLIESEERIRNFTENLPGMSYRCACDKDWTMEYINKGAEKLTGYPAKDFLNNKVRSYASIIHPDDVQMVEDIVMEAVDKKQSFTIDYRIIKADGSTCHVFEQGQGVFDKQGNLRFLDGVILDVSERKQIEKELSYVKDMLEQGNKVATMGAWDFNLVTNNLVWSDITKEIHEVEADYEPDVETAINFYKEGSHRDTISRILTDAMKNGGAWDEELIIVTAKGDEKWVRAMGQPEFKDGSCIRLYGCFQDITERKLAAQKVDIQSKIIDQIHDSVISTDLNGFITSWNKGAEKLFGYTSDEMNGEHISKIYPEEDHAFLKKEIIAPLQEKGEHELESKMLRKNGEIFYANLSLSLQYDENGNVIGMIGYSMDISARKEAEDALKESELWMKNIFNTLDEAVLVVSSDRRLLNINDSAIKMFGYSKKEINDSSTKLLHVSDQHYVDFGELIKKDFSKNRTAHFEFVAKRKSGEIFPTEHTVSLLKSSDGAQLGMVSVVNDISERKKSEMEIQQLAAIVQYSSDFIGFSDLEGHPQFLNDAGRKMVGIETDKQFFDSMIIDYFMDKDREFIENTIIPQVMETGRWTGEIAFRHFQNSEPINVWFDIFRINDAVSGEPVNLGTVTRDIREKKITEQELSRYREHLEVLVKERTKELGDAQEELVRKERLATLGQLTATVSHELRNPLGAMRPSLYIIDKNCDKKDKRIQESIALIDRNIDRCDNIIDELLDYTRITTLNRKFSRIDEWLETIINEQDIMEGIRVEKDLSLNDFELNIDTNRLRRAVINVVDNACHSMLNTNQTEARKDACLRINTRQNNQRIEIIISDNGTGIAKDVLKRIFEPLFSTKGFGVGLGMSIVKQIMEQHSGGIEIDTEENKGATVTLWLPKNASEKGTRETVA